MLLKFRKYILIKFVLIYRKGSEHFLCASVVTSYTVPITNRHMIVVRAERQSIKHAPSPSHTGQFFVGWRPIFLRSKTATLGQYQGPRSKFEMGGGGGGTLVTRFGGHKTLFLINLSCKYWGRGCTCPLPPTPCSAVPEYSASHKPRQSRGLSENVFKTFGNILKFQPSKQFP